MREERPDVLEVQDHLLTVSYVLTARQLQIPLVVEVNAPALESRLYLHQFLHLPWIREWLEAWKLRRANRITVVSSALREYIAQRYSIQSAKIDTVLNGAYIRSFNPQVAPDPKLPEGIASGRVIGYVGSFDPWHGIGLLSKMIQSVAAARPEAVF